MRSVERGSGSPNHRRTQQWFDEIIAERSHLAQTVQNGPPVACKSRRERAGRMLLDGLWGGIHSRMCRIGLVGLLR